CRVENRQAAVVEGHVELGLVRAEQNANRPTGDRKGSDLRLRQRVDHTDRVIVEVGDVRRGPGGVERNIVGTVPDLEASGHPMRLEIHEGNRIRGHSRHVYQPPLLLTPDGWVAEGTVWNVFWWDGDRLRTPALELGILPGIGRARVLELSGEGEQGRYARHAIEGKSLFLTNAVRGIVPLASLDGVLVPTDPRTADLVRRFWPEGSPLEEP